MRGHAGDLAAVRLEWIGPFTGLSPGQFRRLVTVMRR